MWLGAALLVVHSRAVEFSSDVQSDGLYVGLFAAATWLAWRAIGSRRASLAAGAGVAAGLAYLTRPEGLGVALVLAAWAGGAWLSGRWITAGLCGVAGAPPLRVMRTEPIPSAAASAPVAPISWAANSRSISPFSNTAMRVATSSTKSKFCSTIIMVSPAC